MSDRIDHAAAALKTLGQIRGVDEATNQVTLAIEAQVHATLALVEQKRIANRIELGIALSDTAAQGSLGRVLFTPEHEFSMSEILPEIREGLGL